MASSLFTTGYVCPMHVCYSTISDSSSFDGPSHDLHKLIILVPCYCAHDPMSGPQDVVMDLEAASGASFTNARRRADHERVGPTSPEEGFP
jgi:hypothetical protein